MAECNFFYNSPNYPEWRRVELLGIAVEFYFLIPHEESFTVMEQAKAHHCRHLCEYFGMVRAFLRENSRFHLTFRLLTLYHTSLAQKSAIKHTILIFTNIFLPLYTIAKILHLFFCLHAMCFINHTLRFSYELLFRNKVV